MLHVHKLSKSIRQKKILNDLSFSLSQGEVGIFLGRSGVGKSTLLRVLSQLETYDGGSVMFEDTPLTAKSAGHTVGIVFQQFNLFEHLDVERNITLALMHYKKLNKQQAQEIAWDSQHCRRKTADTTGCKCFPT